VAQAATAAVGPVVRRFSTGADASRSSGAPRTFPDETAYLGQAANLLVDGQKSVSASAAQCQLLPPVFGAVELAEQLQRHAPPWKALPVKRVFIPNEPT
jgi:hypothetical protein